MREKLEENGKPCCLNLITDADKKYLKKIERQQKKEEAAENQVTESQVDLAALAESKGLDLAAMSETEKQELADEEAKKRGQVESESEEDEIGALIMREEEEHKRAEMEAAEKLKYDQEMEKER